MGLVVGLDLRVGGLDRGGVVLGVEALPLDVARVEQRVEGRLPGRRGHETALADAALDLRARQLLADVLEQQVAAQSACGEEGVALRLRHRAQLLVLRVVPDLVEDALVADRQALVHDGGAHHALAHQRVERLALELGRVEQLQVDLRVARADRVDVRAALLLPVGPRDVAAVHRRDRDGLFVGLQVALKADETERRDDHDAEDHLQDTVVRPNEIKHEKPLGTGRANR